MLIYMAVITDDRAGTMAAAAPLFGLEPEGWSSIPTPGSAPSTRSPTT